MIQVLNRLFEDIKKEKNQFLNSATGTEFEDRIKANLKKHRFDEIYQDLIPKEKYKEIKEKILDKKSSEIVENDLDSPQFKNCFIYQPYGKQNFPDFLIFTKKYIVALEIKYSKNKNKSPMWNSNLPKGNAIYIFGSYGLKDITFFKGSDILPEEERNLLVDFFESTKKMENRFKKLLKEKYLNQEIKQEKGFFVYVRRAYTQGKTINENAENDYFKFKNRLEMEEKVIKFAKEISRSLESESLECIKA